MATFGNTNSQSIARWPLPEYMFVVKYTTPADCTSIDRLTVKLSNTLTGHGACNVKGLIYAADGSDGRPRTRVAVGNAIAVADSFADWKVLTFGANSVSPSTDYWWGLVGDSNAVGLGVMSNSGGGLNFTGPCNYASPPSPLSAGLQYTYTASIYMTYTPGAGGNPHYYYAQQ